MLVPVVAMGRMTMTVVYVVRVVIVRDGDMPTARPVVVRLIGMGMVRRHGSHLRLLQSSGPHPPAVTAAGVCPPGPSWI
jgi:hypothetical protein